MVNLASNASQVLPANDPKFSNGWVNIALASSIGWQVAMVTAVTGTIIFETSADADPRTPGAPIFVGPAPLILVAPDLAISTPAAVAVNYNFSFDAARVAAKWMRARWAFASGGAAAGALGLNIRFLLREVRV